MKSRFLIVCVSIFWILMWCTCVIAGDVEIIPPEILAQMDKDILSGKRPKIAKLRQGEIFGLRGNPRIEADFVTFDFNINNLSSVQKEIIHRWVRTGVNKIYLLSSQIGSYALFFDPAKGSNLGSSDRYDTDRFLRHVVNTDCKSLQMWVKGYFKDLPLEAEVIVEGGGGVAVAGSFKVGDGIVFFSNEPTGTDARRWRLNWWHWALGLQVPGATNTSIANVPSVSLSQAARLDSLRLKNGDIVFGRILNEKFTLKTDYASLVFNRDTVQAIICDINGGSTDVLSLLQGDRLTGSLEDPTVRINLSSGETVEVEVSKVKEIVLKP